MYAQNGYIYIDSPSRKSSHTPQIANFYSNGIAVFKHTTLTNTSCMRDTFSYTIISINLKKSLSVKSQKSSYTVNRPVVKRVISLL